MCQHKKFSFPPTSIQLSIANQIFKILFQKSGEITPARYPIVGPWKNFFKKIFKKKIQNIFRGGPRPVPPSLRVNRARPLKILQGFFIPSSKKIFLGGDYYSYTHYFPRLSKETPVLGPSRRAQCHPTTARRAPISCGLAWRHPRLDGNKVGRSPLSLG